MIKCTLSVRICKVHINRLFFAVAKGTVLMNYHSIACVSTDTCIDPVGSVAMHCLIIDVASEVVLVYSFIAHTLVRSSRECETRWAVEEGEGNEDRSVL